MATRVLKLEYVNEGELVDYIRLYSKLSESDRAVIIRSVSAALLYVYSRKVLL